jgi:hypothetical protein
MPISSLARPAPRYIDNSRSSGEARVGSWCNAVRNGRDFALRSAGAGASWAVANSPIVNAMSTVMYKKDFGSRGFRFQLVGQRTFVYVRLSSLTCLPGFNDNRETGSGWKA